MPAEKGRQESKSDYLRLCISPELLEGFEYIKADWPAEEVIRWTIDFLNTDWNACGPMEKLDHVVKYISFAACLEITNISGRIWDGWYHHVGSEQTQLRYYLNGLIDFDDLITTAMESQVHTLYVMDKSPDYSAGKYSLKVLGRVAKMVGPYEGHGPYPEFYPEGFQIRLMLALNGLPDYAIGRCEECGKFIYQTTARTKRYCSQRCNWRANTRRRRAREKKNAKP